MNGMCSLKAFRSYAVCDVCAAIHVAMQEDEGAAKAAHAAFKEAAVLLTGLHAFSLTCVFLCFLRRLIRGHVCSCEAAKS